MRHVVCKADEIKPGSMISYWHKGKYPIVIIRNADGQFFGLYGRCPHQGANLGAGLLTFDVNSDNPGCYEIGDDGTILRCPWHGFEFAVDSGRCVTDPDGMRVRSYRVAVEDGDVVLYL